MFEETRENLREPVTWYSLAIERSLNAQLLGNFMCGCVLRVSGPFDQLRHSIRNSPIEFQESIASRRKRERAQAPADNRCTFNYTVSDADGDKVPVQITEAEQFLTSYFDHLDSLRSADGVEDACLDFGWFFPNTTPGQFNHFPYSLLQMCGKLRIDIVVSVYGSVDTI